jgi:hypothetical protein
MQYQSVFLISFLGFTIIWMMAGGLSLVGRAHWLGIGLAAGLLTGISISLIPMPSVSIRGPVVIIAAYGVAMLPIGYAVYQGYIVPGKEEGPSSLYRLPFFTYVVTEAAPYFLYGSIYMLLIMLPHYFGWRGAYSPGQDPAFRVTSTEVGLTLSMPPVILAYGVAEYALRTFWRVASVAQVSVSGETTGMFGQSLSEFCDRQRKYYIVILSILTVGAYFLFQVAIEAGLLTKWLHLSDLSAVTFIFNTSLVAYALIGVGLFNCMFAVTLGHPRVAVNAVTWAAVTMIVFGLLLADVSFMYVPIGFVLAGAVFAALSWLQTSEVVQSCDYSFASVI